MLALTAFYIISVIPSIVVDILDNVGAYAGNFRQRGIQYNNAFDMWGSIFSWSNIIVYAVISRYVHIVYPKAKIKLYKKSAKSYSNSAIGSG